MSDEADTTATATAVAAVDNSSGGKSSMLIRCIKIKFTTPMSTTRRWSPKIKKYLRLPGTTNGKGAISTATGSTASETNEKKSASAGGADKKDNPVTESVKDGVTTGDDADQTNKKSPAINNLNNNATTMTTATTRRKGRKTTCRQKPSKTTTVKTTVVKTTTLKTKVTPKSSKPTASLVKSFSSDTRMITIGGGSASRPCDDCDYHK